MAIAPMTMVTSAPAPVRSSVTADPIAGVLLILAGTAGILELLLPWRPAVKALPSYSSLTGWDLFVIGRSQALSAGDTLALYSVLGVAVVGGACLLLGLAMFAPIDHHPLGAIALLCSVVSIGGAIWWILQNRTAVGGIGTLFGQGEFGFYLFLAAGVIGLAGAIKALATP
jgi:hypothetical protein